MKHDSDIVGCRHADSLILRETLTQRQDATSRKNWISHNAFDLQKFAAVHVAHLRSKGSEISLLWKSRFDEIR